MQYKPKCCWDCGVSVIGDETHQSAVTPRLRQVRFRRTDGAYHDSPFCTTCAVQPWPPERIAAYEAAIRAVAPDYPGVAFVEGPHVA